MKTIKKFFNELINTFLPKCCVLCKKRLGSDESKHLCKTCWNKFQPIEGLFCQKCGKSLPDGGKYCYSCRRLSASSTHFEYIRAAGVYAGTLREAIHKFKYQGKDFLAVSLGEFIVTQSQDKYPWSEIDFVVPVPLHRIDQIRRGYNQAQILAEVVAKELGKSLSVGNLTRNRKTKKQTELSREKRLTNLVDAFKILNPTIFKSKNIILIDDVCTTGSTIEECSKEMRRAGAKKVWGLVLAHAA